MKKFLALALAVLAVAAAQAVTINWTAKLKDSSGAAAGISGMAILTTHVDTVSHPQLWQIISWTDNKENTVYTANTSNGYAFIEQVKMNGTSTYTTPTMTNGVFTHTTTFDAKNGNELALVFFNKYHQGATVVNVTLENMTADSIYDINLGELKYTINKNLPDVITRELTVPEPTALALLALGVAGLALKRKVA